MKIPKISDLSVFSKVAIRGTFIYCPFCHGIEVKHGEPHIIEDANRHDEVYDIECQHCGKKGFIVESWEVKPNENH